MIATASHTIFKKNNFAWLHNITSKWWSMECYLVITCLLLDQILWQERQMTLDSWFDLPLRWLNSKQSDREIRSFVIISFHELICAMKTNGQWPWTETAQYALINETHNQDQHIITYLDWKRSSGWLESWEGLLLETDVSTTCAEAIFRVKW